MQFTLFPFKNMPITIPAVVISMTIAVTLTEPMLLKDKSCAVIVVPMFAPMITEVA